MCVLNATEEQKRAVFDLVEGDRVEVDKLGDVCDVAAVKETYQITEAESKVTPLSLAVINRISSKISKKIELVKQM